MGVFMYIFTHSVYKYHFTYISCDSWQFRPVITPENAETVRLISVYHCHVSKQEGGTKQVFDTYVGQTGRECYGPTAEPDWTTHCFAYLFTWALGSEGKLVNNYLNKGLILPFKKYETFPGEMLPAHVGIPLGESPDETTYFKLEVHYDNPTRRTCKT